MGFGKRFRQLRLDRNMSVREVASKAGMDFTLLSKMELEMRPPPEIHFIFALVDALEIEDAKKLEEIMEELVTLATESHESAGQRLTEEQLQKFRCSESARVFMRLKPKGKREGGKSK